MEKLFNPQSIAIVGASSEDGTVGNVLAKNLLRLGYIGKIYLVNPKYEEIFGNKCYGRLSEINESVDLAIIAIPAKLVAEEIKANASKIKNYVIISAGFSEVGEEGRKREEYLSKIAEENDLNVLGPNCLGFIIPSLKLNASFSGGLPLEGNIAFISQSGALAVAMMDIARYEDIKFSSVVSIGNKMRLSETEILEYFSDDRKTKVVGMYLEGIKDGKNFMNVAKKVVLEKPVVVIKAGKTEKSRKAISSHTGAMAGSEEITDAVFRKIGLIKVSDLEEFFDLVDLISHTKASQTDKVAVITNAGGPGVLTTDAFLGKNIQLADLDEKTKDKIRKILPPESAVDNPIDMLGDAKEDRYANVLKIIEKNESIGSIICVLTPQDQTPVDKIARKIINFKKKTSKTVVAVFIGGDRVKKAIKKLEENGIPNYVFPDRAVKSLDHYYRWNANKNLFGSLKSEAHLQMETNEERKRTAFDIIDRARREGRSALYFSEAKRVVGMYGIETVAVTEIESGPPERVDFPVVLKVDSDKVLHKTDKKGLILNIKNQENLSEAVARMKNNFPGEKLIIQPMAERQMELILGIKKDPVFGPIIMYGLGGIYAEFFRQVDFLVPPLTKEEIKNNLLKSKIMFLFGKTRGQNPYNIEELVEVLYGVSSLACELEGISEFDINPMLIYNNGKKTLAVDIKIII